MSENRNPSPKEVQLIYKDTYNYYTKWIAVNEPNWSELMNECRTIEHKYPFELCYKMLVELVDIIEKSYTERTCNNG